MNFISPRRRHRIIGRAAALLIALASASPVAALSRKAEPDRPAAPATITLSPLARLQLEAAAGRAATLNGAGGAFDRLSAAPDDPQALIRDLSPRRRGLFDAILSQSIQFATLKGDDGVVAWFDPFTETWLISDWSRAGQNWRMTKLGAVSSQALASTDAATPWRQRGASLAEAIRQQALDAHAVFKTVVASGGAERLIDDAPRSRANLADAIDRAEASDDRLTELERTAAYKHYSSYLTTIFLTHTRAIQASPGAKQAIGSLSGAERLSLRTVDVFERPDGATFAVQSPLAPALVFVVDYRAAGGAAPASPARMKTINLLETER